MRHCSDPALPRTIRATGPVASESFHRRRHGAATAAAGTGTGTSCWHGFGCCHCRAFHRDTFPEFGVVNQPSASHTLHLDVDDVDAWWNRAVAAGATVTLPLEQQFWGARYGKLRDPFGVNWSLSPKA